MYLKIVNSGHVDPLAFTLVGASTKKGNKSKIGMFGSGNKYAIAYLFRNEYDFRVFSGENEICFHTEPRSMYESIFNVIFINGKETSITTDMGSHWSLWQAIRELYSNALDEGLINFELAENIKYGTSGYTEIYIEMKPDLVDMWENIGDYFAIKKEVLFECEVGKIYKKQSPNTCIYRKGIRCFDTNKNSIFDYDFNNIAIDENRIVQFSWDLPQEIWKLLYQCDNEYVVRTVLNKIQEKGLVERGIDDSFVHTDSDKISDTWKKCLKHSNIVPDGLGGYLKDSEVPSTKILPTRLYHDIIGKFGEELKPKSFKNTSSGVSYRVAQPTELQLEMLKGVLKWFEECKFEINYGIDIVDFMSKDVHGGVSGSTICIGINAFDRGSTWVANVIIEEYIHIRYDAPDESRKFQDEAIGLLLRYMQEHNAYKL